MEAGAAMAGRRAFFAHPRKETLCWNQKGKNLGHFPLPLGPLACWEACIFALPPGGHSVAGGTGLVEQLHRMLVASGGVLGCSHKLEVREAYLWRGQVATEPLCLQLYSKIVLVHGFREPLSPVVG